MLKNATYLEQYVPDADQVSRVEVSLDYPVEYKGDSVRVARQAQKEILSHAEIYRKIKRMTVHRSFLLLPEKWKNALAHI